MITLRAMISDLFGYLGYRDYLRKEFSGTGPGRGRRARLAHFLKCQTSFISQVLTDRAHLSLEHALRTSEFLKHADHERDYFMLLVQKEKAGNRALESYFENQSRGIRKRRQEIRERIKIKTELSAEDQMRYYSTWFYAALHVLSALPGLNTVEQMSERLKLDVETIKEALSFLETRGFIERRGSQYSIGSRRIHLAKGSPMLPRHHSNWRMKAVEAVDRERPRDLHYSAVLGISAQDVPRFKEKLLKVIEELEPMIQESSEESPVVLIMDLFEL